VEGVKRTDLLRLLFFVALFHRAKHPFCHGLVADTEFDGGVQDGGSEDGVRVSPSRSRTWSVSTVSVHGKGGAETVPRWEG
jgi:hypothetical protein